MKKQSGFTLIELMVVMAIIAILATGGLSAYTGYIKKSRDSHRISDIRFIQSAIQGALSIKGLPPSDLSAAVSAANNGQSVVDPFGTGTCFKDAAGTTTGPCGYSLSSCDGGAGYLVTALFESKGNLGQYTTVGGRTGYNMGTCTVLDSSDGGGCTTVGNTCGDGTMYLSSSLRALSSSAGTYQWVAAVNYCATLNANTHADWHLPTKDELAILYTNRVAMSAPLVYYWSSTDYNAGSAWSQDFSNGAQYTDQYGPNKLGAYSVRCVRGV